MFIVSVFPFYWMVVGMTKPDWVYDGLDATFEIWELLNHDTERFKLIGFTTRLPEAVAILWDANTRKSSLDALRFCVGHCAIRSAGSS